MSPIASRKPAARVRAPDPRRWLALAISLLAMGLAIAIRSGGDSSSSLVLSAALWRVGLVIGAIWLAWDSLRKPAKWFPPGMLLGGLVLLAILASQPRFILVAGPAVGVLLTVGAFVRSMRGRSR